MTATAPKSPNNVACRLHSSIQQFCFWKISGTNVGAPNWFLPRAPFNLFMLLFGMRAFLFCRNVWPSCYVTIPQFCHNVSWCWHNTSDLLHISLVGKGLCWCSFEVCECMGRNKGSRNCENAFNFFQAIFAPPSKWRPWHVLCLPYPIYATVCNQRPYWKAFAWKYGIWVKNWMDGTGKWRFLQNLDRQIVYFLPRDKKPEK